MATRRSLEFSPDRYLAAYYRKTRSFPLLGAADELALARRYRRFGDARAAEALVGAHLRLVVRVARGYRGYSLPLAELIAEGNVGLLQSLRGFDPEREVRFATYALWWIRAAIQDYILRSWSLVKIGTTAAQKKLFFNLRRAKARMAVLDGDLRPDQAARIAEELAVTEQDVVLMN
jgi:RNA polymerase sigma-32 factor